MNNPPNVSLHRTFPRRAPRLAPGIESYGTQLWRQSAVEFAQEV